MVDQNPKISSFNSIMNTIAREAQRQSAEAVAGAEKRRDDAIARANEQLSFETGDIKRRKIAEIKTAAGVSISAAENASRAGLFKRREEIRKEIFSSASEEIKKFTETDSYKELLISSAKKIVRTMNGRCAVLTIREADKKFAAEICGILGNSITLHIDNSIKLGGIIVNSTDGKMMIDDTLDERLNQQQKWFMENSGMVVE